MKRKQFRKKILSAVLAWTLIIANVLPGMSVQASSMSDNDVAVTQEVSSEEEIVQNTEVSEEVTISGNIEETSQEGNSESAEDSRENSSESLEESQEEYSDSTEHSKEEAVLEETEKEDVEDESISENSSEAQEVVVLPQNQIAAVDVSVMAVADTTEYEIYPTPHSMTYGDGGYEVGNVNLVYDNGFNDAATKNRMEEILRSKNISFTNGNKIASGKTNILIGIYSADNKGYAQTELEKAETVTAADFDKITAHYVVSKNNTIYVLGKDVDAAFYGVTTLKHVFAQMNDKVIRNFTVKDYADVAIRGFIEGYYGIPWSNEDRMSLMKFGGDFKMTSYVFAPKDDIYHTTKWRELYPDDEIAKIREMVAVGNASKCRFVWTAHPFMNGGNFGGGGRSVEAEIQALLNKFDQLYDAGVRQFGVLSDDVSGVSYAMIIQVMKAVSQWAISKGDVYDTVFCPQGYNHSWQSGGYGQNYAELNAFDPEFPDNIQIFWTGESVCQPIIPLTLEHFMTHNLSQGAEARRAPLFWLNWPVNDINHSRMVMGKGSQMKTDVNPQHLAGVVTNPLQEAEASKNALFAVADYTWNIANFDEDQSWEDGFKYIEPDATEELHTLAKHMSDPSPNSHGLNLEESFELKPLLEAYAANGSGGEQLIEEFEKIVAACDNFHLKSKNENLKDELLPFTNSLKDLVNAGIKFIETQAAIDNGDEDLVWSSYSQASALLRSSRTYVKPTRSVPEIVDPGSKRIIPFVEGLNTKLSPTVMSMVDDSKQFVTFITNRSDFSSSMLETVTDNDETTQVIGKSPNSIAIGDYVGLSLTKGEDITSITFKMGQSGNANDSFSSAKIEYTTNGKDWLTVPGSEYTDNRGTVSVTGLSLTGVKGVRLIATADKTNTWLGIKDILINGKGYNEKAALPGNKYAATFFKPDRYTVYQGNVDLISDENDGTFIWFGVNCNKDDAIGIDLGDTKEVGSIHFAMPAGDCMSNYSIQYSTNNTNWTKLGDYTALITDIDLNSSPIQARYIRVVSNANTNKWLKIAELTARDPYVKVYPVYTNKEEVAVASMTANVGVDTSTLTGNVTLAPGEYVGVDMERIKDVTSITAEFTGNVKLQLSKNELVWYEYDLTKPIAAYEEARFVRFINDGTENVDLNVTSLEVKSFELAPISVKATSFGNQGSHLLAFDQDRTTEAILQGSQNAGQYIIYDLGQTIDLESLRLVLHDSTTDYPRHAKVSVSKDNSAWEPIMLIGNQDAANSGEAENTDSIFDLFPIHDVSYNILEQDNINLEVRYIKFEITRTKVGADKWVRIREIELNGGDLYMPEENNPVIQSGAGEDYGNTFSNMLDGDVSTLYTPMKNEAGEFVYNIPGNTSINQVTILQNPMTISEAIVTARVVENGEEKEVTLGNLSGSLNRFATDRYEGVLAITVAWEKDKLPGIYEIILDRKAGSISNNTIVKQLAHTVSFNSMGGTEVESRMVEDNGKVAKPINPTKEGFRFAGWYLGDTAYNFTAPITSSITLTARWTEIVYHTVSFNSMGGSEVGSVRVEDKEKVSKPSDPTKEGSRFAGWYLEETAYDFTSPVTESITLTARWTEIVYHTVSFNSMGGS
ncbi:MAG: beta-N-acetylglucosaminidase domain-containing protein, partial [Lachnospiraceae bacterium]|nr:beta-N-acetylglucosaminidase domain-containing protein [Lachnospiraceae bacterium]